MVAERELSIWGRQDCLLPNGKFCVACCYSMTINTMGKPGNKLCEYAQIDKGCKLKGNGPKSSSEDQRELREQACGPFFCSPRGIDEIEFGLFPEEAISPAGREARINQIRLKLIEAAMDLGQVTLKEAQAAVSALTEPENE